MTPDLLLRRTLRIQLSAYLPAAELEGPFTAETEAPLLTTTFRLVDAAVRVLAPAALSSGHPASADGLRALAPVTDRALALKTMMSIEKVAHATKGPGPFFRAIGGVPSASVLVADAEPTGSEERLERAVGQLSGALVRVVAMSQKLGLSTDALLGPLRNALSVD
jgi:hypothetical protein